MFAQAKSPIVISEMVAVETVRLRPRSARPSLFIREIIFSLCWSYASRTCSSTDPSVKILDAEFSLPHNDLRDPIFGMDGSVLRRAFSVQPRDDPDGARRRPW